MKHRIDGFLFTAALFDAQTERSAVAGPEAQAPSRRPYADSLKRPLRAVGPGRDRTLITDQVSAKGSATI
jgi:hypothetical protein